MIKLGMHVDNWRHFDQTYHVPCEFAAKNGMEYVEFGTVNGDYFVHALGYNPHVALHMDPLRLKRYLDGLNLKVSQIDAAYPMSGPDGQYRGIPYTIEAIKFARAVGAVPMGGHEIDGVAACLGGLERAGMENPGGDGADPHLIFAGH